MVTGQKSGEDWSDQEIDLIVGDYFSMLEMDLAGLPYVKAHRNAELQKMTGRSRGSIEFKHQNISAVLRRLGLPWIPGYKPMSNFQRALIDGVERFLSAPKGLQFQIATPGEGFSEEPGIFVGPPPPIFPTENSDPPVLRRLVRKFDPAARDERNRALGRRGEERVLATERARLQAAGRLDLAEKIRWISEEEGDGAGFDILSYNNDGEERYLEVKTTNGHALTPFYLSENERSFSEEQPGKFRLFRVYDFMREPKAFRLVPPLENSVILKVMSYRASFSP